MIEVLVGMALATALYFGIMGMSSVMFKSATTAQGDFEWLLLQNNILMILNNSRLCGYAFRDAAGNPATYPTNTPPGQAAGTVKGIYLASSFTSPPTPIAVAGKPLANGVTVDRVELRQSDIPSDKLQVNSPMTGGARLFNRSYAQLYLQVSRGVAKGAMPSFFGTSELDNQLEMPLVTLLTDTSGVIQQCYSGSASASNPTVHLSLPTP